MKRLFAALLALAAAVALYFVLRSESGAPEAARGPTDQGSVGHASAAPELATGEAAGERFEIAAEPSAVAALSPADTAPERARIRGVVVHHDGRAAIDAHVSLDGWQARGERGPNGETLVEGVELTASVASDGAFEFVFASHPELAFALEITAAMAPLASKQFATVAEDADIDLGRIELPLGGRITGRIERSGGGPAAGAWSVAAVDHWSSDWRVIPNASVEVRADSSDQSFVIDGVAAGVVEVTAYSDGDLTDEIGPLDVLVEAGGTSELVIVYDGPDLARRLVVEFRARILDTFPPPAREAVTLFDASGRAVDAPWRSTNQGRRCVWDDIEPGAYTLRVDDPRFEFVDGAAVQTGALQRVTLRGSVALTLAVFEQESGAPVGGANFEVRRFGLPARPGPNRTLPPRPDASSHEALFHVVPDPQTWIVKAPGFGAATVDLEQGVPPRSNQRLEVRLTRALAIRGRVLRADGSPLAGVDVVACAAIEPPQPQEERDAYLAWRNREKARERVRCTTKGDGSFELTPLAAGHHDVATDLPAPATAFALAVAAGTEDLELCTAPAGHLTVRIEPRIRNVEHMLVSVTGHRPLGDLPPAIAHVVVHNFNTRVDEQGVAQRSWLAVGSYTLAVTLPGYSIDSPRGSSRLSGRNLDPVPFTIVDGETTEVVVDISNDVPLILPVRVDEPARTGVALVVFGEHFEPLDQAWRLAAVGPVDATGRANVEPVHPGRWRFRVAAFDESFEVPVPGEYDITADTLPDVSASVALVRSTLKLVDESGAALLQARVTLRGSVLVADAEGDLPLVLPIGRHTLTVDRPFRSAPIEFDWTSGGPIEAQLVAKPRP